MGSRIKRVIVVVVLYEIDLISSTTALTLNEAAAKSDNILDVFVYDNSNNDRSTPFIDLFSNLNITVYHDSKNSGVSRAYNFSVEKYERSKDWFLLFDQDTKVPRHALESYLASCDVAGKYDVDLLVPVVKDSNEIIWSPSKEFLFKGIHINKKKMQYGLVDSESLLYINSGVMINYKVFDKIGKYDEDLFYFSDHEFFKRYRSKFPKSYVIDLELIHDISSHGRDGIDDANKRLPILLRDSKVYAKKVKSLLPIFWYLVQVIKLSSYHHTLKLLKHLILWN